MQRVAIILRLKPGAHERAKDMLVQGPPFDVAATTFKSHSVYLSEAEAVFVFEGPDVEWELDDLTSDVFHPALQRAFDEWRELIQGGPQLAREVYFWEQGDS